MKSKPEYWYNQSAIVPYRKTNNGLELLIITSIKKKKWIFPKGIVEENLTARESSLKEAFEEAGVKGELLDKKLGKYNYKKWGGKCKVKVFALNVTTIFENWEEDFRERKWVKLNEIHTFVKDDAILKITSRLGEILSIKT